MLSLIFINPKSTEGLEHPNYYLINLGDCKDSRDSKNSKHLDSWSINFRKSEKI